MTVGADSSGVSALYVLRQYAMLRASTQRYTIGGGMDRLPDAMGAALAGVIRYNAPVVRVERQSTGFRVDYREGEAVKSVAAARVVFAVPASTMRQTEMKPRLPRLKEQAIEQLSYYDGVRFLLQVKRPFWKAAGLSGSARTDRATEIWDAASDQPASSRGILGATAAGGGARARHIRRASPRASISSRTLFPGYDPRSKRARSPVERGPLVARGVRRVRPGQMTTLVPVIAQRKIGLHFAGEHTSSWMSWMEGALESGERAAREDARLGRTSEALDRQ